MLLLKEEAIDINQSETASYHQSDLPKDDLQLKPSHPGSVEIQPKNPEITTSYSSIPLTPDIEPEDFSSKNSTTTDWAIQRQPEEKPAATQDVGDGIDSAPNFVEIPSETESNFTHEPLDLPAVTNLIASSDLNRKSLEGNASTTSYSEHLLLPDNTPENASTASHFEPPSLLENHSENILENNKSSDPDILQLKEETINIDQIDQIETAIDQQSDSSEESIQLKPLHPGSVDSTANSASNIEQIQQPQIQQPQIQQQIQKSSLPDAENTVSRSLNEIDRSSSEFQVLSPAASNPSEIIEIQRSPENSNPTPEIIPDLHLQADSPESNLQLKPLHPGSLDTTTAFSSEVEPVQQTQIQTPQTPEFSTTPAPTPEAPINVTPDQIIQKQSEALASGDISESLSSFPDSHQEPDQRVSTDSLGQSEIPVSLSLQAETQNGITPQESSYSDTLDHVIASDANTLQSHPGSAVQRFSATQFPPLPTVIKDLTVLKPLVQRSALPSAEESPSITESIPNSLPGLFSELSISPFTDASTQTDNIQRTEYYPDAAPSSQDHHPGSSSPFSHLPQLPRALQNLTVLKPLVQRSPDESPLESPSPSQTHSSLPPSPKPDRPQPTSTPATSHPGTSTWSSLAELVNPKPAQPQPISHTSQYSPLVIQAKLASSNAQEQSNTATPFEFPDTPVTTISTDDFTPDPNLDENLETLAQEIYSRLRQKLEFERERHGGSHGRIPW
jgi:hypothetical protein